MCTSKNKRMNNLETCKEAENEENEGCEEYEAKLTNKTIHKYWENMFYILGGCKTYLYYIFTASSIYLLWIVLHYAAAHMYVKFCTPYTIVGFIASPFLTSTPHCRALRWAIYNGASMIDGMWLVLGTWVCSKIFMKPT